MLRDGVAHKTI